MRIWSVTPVRVDATELARRRERYRRISPPGVTWTLEAAGQDAPPQLDTGSDIEASTRSVTAALASAPDGYDLRLPDCVLDPGVPADPPALQEAPAPDATGERGGVPVAGMLRLAAGHLVATGRRFGAVARNAALADALAARLDRYGFGPWCAGVTPLHLPFAAVSDPRQWNAAVTEALDGFAARGIRTVLNGCSAVDPGHGHPVELIDPAQLAPRLLAAGGHI